MRKLIDFLPPADTSQPWSQICFVFDEFIRILPNRAAKLSYINVKSFYLKFLNEQYSQGVVSGFEIGKIWSKYSFVELRDKLWMLVEKDKYSSFTIAGYLYMLRKVMTFAVANELILPIIFCSIPAAETETDIASPYDQATYELIGKAIQAEFDALTKLTLSNHYVHTGMGADPRLNKVLPVNNPWRRYENQVWYFENVLNAVPLPALPNVIAEHKLFFRFLKRPITKFYEKVGVFPGPYQEVVGLCAFLIARITGLNSSSIFNLQVDCIQQSDKSGFVYLQYFKNRSSGSKFLTRDVLTKEKFEKLQKLVTFMLSISNPLRPLIDCKILRKRLFIVIGKKQFRSFNIRDMGVVARKLEKKYGIKTNISFRRFRATEINEDIVANRDPGITQEKYGHEHGQTTLSYGSKNALEREAIREIGIVLSRRFRASMTGSSGVFFKTQLAYCDNPFKPPFASVKLPCALVHKCLACPNFRFSVADMPRIVNYFFSIKANRLFQLKQLPNQRDYEETVRYAESILVEHNLHLTSLELNEIIDKAVRECHIIDPIIN